jgi:hypothetical protein
VKILEGTNLALRFFLELSALAAVGYWGWKVGEGVARWAFALASVAVVTLVWALFVSEKARIEIGRPLQLAIEFAVWAAAGAALYGTGHPRLGLAFVLVAVLSGTLNYVRD